MPAAARQIIEDARTYDVFIECDRNVAATMREEILARNTVKNRVRRHTARMHEAATDVAIEYAMFERQYPGQRLQPCDREFVWRTLHRRHGADYANALTSDTMVEKVRGTLPYARRLTADPDPENAL